MAWCWRSPALSSDSRRGRALSSCLKLFFFKQKTAYEIDCDWSSDVCSSDLGPPFSNEKGGPAFKVRGITLPGGFTLDEIGRASCRESVDLGGRRIIKKKR